LKIELVLANGNKFDQIGKIGAIEADFNNETGNIAFRADFPNLEGLRRPTAAVVSNGNLKLLALVSTSTVPPANEVPNRDSRAVIKQHQGPAVVRAGRAVRPIS